jgi:hypothetical protein
MLHQLLVIGYNFVGSTIRFGDGASNTSGSVHGFDIDGGGTYFVGNIHSKQWSINRKSKIYSFI